MWLKRSVAQKAWRVSATHASVQNKRASMEDVLFYRTCGPRWLGAVMDGHGGAEAALICARVVEKRSELLEGAACVEAWARGTIAACEAECVSSCASGCTIVLCVMLMDRGECMCAWVGDSGAVFCTDAEFASMCRPHKPDDPAEAARIRRDGGFVSGGRTNGVLAMSRAIGDAALKPAVSASPDVLWTRADKRCRVGLFTDGLSDAMDEVLIAKACAEGYSPDQIVSVAIKNGSMDNITLLVASFEYDP
jgi:serine/threonine protein phosphatase PrpC